MKLLMHLYLRNWNWNNHVAPTRLTLIKIASWLEKTQVFMALLQRPENGKKLTQTWMRVQFVDLESITRLKSKMRIAKRNLPWKSLQNCWEDALVFWVTKSTHSFKIISRRLDIKGGLVNFLVAIATAKDPGLKIFFDVWALFAVWKPLGRYIFRAGLKTKQSRNSYIKSLIKLRNIKFRPP